MDDAVETDNCFIECDNVLFVDKGIGSDSMDSLISVLCDEYDIAY